MQSVRDYRSGILYDIIRFFDIKSYRAHSATGVTFSIIIRLRLAWHERIKVKTFLFAKKQTFLIHINSLSDKFAHKFIIGAK